MGMGMGMGPADSRRHVLRIFHYFFFSYMTFILLFLQKTLRRKTLLIHISAHYSAASGIGDRQM